MFRKKYFIKPRLQLKYIVISLLTVFFTSLCVYYTFWISLIRSPGLEQLSSGEWKALEHAYQISFAWVVIILLVAIGFESLFIFHRLVGPVFVIEKAVKSISDGNLSVEINLRKTDELRELAADVQTMSLNIKKAVTDDRKNIESIKKLIESGKIEPAKKEISNLTQWFKIQ
jgi:methyl-accepting chemotaxis protein